MEKITKILTFACLILFSCQEQELPRKSINSCLRMTLSNALPVQFWLNGEETFNEKVVPGVTPVCWCQPLECNDQVDIQMLDEDSVIHSTTLPGLSSFVNHFGFGNQWTISTSPSTSVGSFGVSNYLKGTLTNWPTSVYPGGSYVFNYNVDIESSPGFDMTVMMLDADADIDHPIASGTVTLAGPGTMSGQVTVLPNATYGNQVPHYVAIIVNNLGSGTRTFTINNGGFTLESITPEPNEPDEINLSVQDTDGNELVSIPFNATLFDDYFLYSISFTLSDYDICNQELQFVIANATETVSDSAGSPSQWSNSGTGNTYRPWRILPYDYVSKFIKSPVLSESIPSGGSLTVTLTLGPSNSTPVKVHLLNSSDPEGTRQEIDFGSIDTGSHSETVITTAVFDQIEIECSHSDGGQEIEITSIELSLNDVSINIPNNSFVSTLSPWFNEDLGFTDWFWDSGNRAGCPIGSDPSNSSNRLVNDQIDVIPPSTDVLVSVPILDDSANNSIVTAHLYNETSGMWSQFDSQIVTDTDTALIQCITDPVGNTTKIGISVSAITPGTPIFYIDDVTASITENLSVPAFNLWTQNGDGYEWVLDGSGITFSSRANGFSVFFEENGEVSDVAESPCVVSSGKAVTVNLSYLSDADVNIQLALKNNGVLVISIEKTLTASGDSMSETIVLSSDITDAELTCTSGGETDFQIIELTISEYGIIAKSDCVSVMESHLCTIPIYYSNSKNFNNLIYQDISPVPTFTLRIPAVFFEVENPAEQEDTELSSGEIVRLYNKLEEKQKLDIGFMPQYMHRKLQLVLMHDQIEIDGRQRIRRDEYEKVQGNKNYPLRRASVFLHDKDFIRENQL